MERKLKICSDCGNSCLLWKSNPPLCKYCAAKPKNKKKDPEKEQRKKELNVFFASQMLEIPKHCENCGCPLNLSSSWEIRKQTAHILMKSKQNGFPSLAIHPMNRMFLCCDSGNYCHSLYDSTIEARKGMKVWTIAIERFEAFKSLLNQSDLQRAKKYLGIDDRTY